MRMIRSVVVCAVLVAALYVRSAAAGPVLGWVDYPAMGEEGYAEMGEGMFQPAGWAMDCESGQLPPNASVVAHRLSIGEPQWVVPSVTVYSGLYRPDVQTAWIGMCPNASAYTGYALHLTPDLPPGYWEVWVSWASAPGVQTSHRLVVEIVGS